MGLMTNSIIKAVTFTKAVVRFSLTGCFYGFKITLRNISQSYFIQAPTIIEAVGHTSIFKKTSIDNQCLRK
jgi:hypothetical protein